MVTLPVLRVVRVEVGDADDRVAGLLLGVGEDLVVLPLEPEHVREVLERDVLVADLVQPPDHRQQRAVEIALADLVLL